MTRRTRSRDAGFTLLEVLVTVGIVGISTAVFVGGMGAAVMGADHHRKQAVGQANIRNFSEAIKAAPYDPVCATARTTYERVYSPSPPTRISLGATASNVASHVAPSVTPGSPNSRLLTFFTLASGSGLTTPTGMTPQWTAASGATNQVRTGLFDQQWGPITATGPRSADSSLADSIAQTVVLESATGAAGAIAPRGTSGPTLGADGTTLTLSKPGGTVKGDAMIAQIAVRGGTATTVTAPVGWLLVDARDNGLAIKSLIYERTATSAATEPFTWTFGSNPEATGGMISYGGAATASTAFVDDVWFWNGTTFVDPGPTDPVPSDPCPAEGLQRVFLRVTSKDGRSIEQVEVVKRQP